MTEPTLPPATRATDPETSLKAEKIITDDGRRITKTGLAAFLVQAYPNHTVNELYQRYLFHYRKRGYFRDANALSKRLSDAEALGLVEKRSARECNETGFECSTWERTALTEKAAKERKRSRQDRNGEGLPVGMLRKELRSLAGQLGELDHIKAAARLRDIHRELVQDYNTRRKAENG